MPKFKPGTEVPTPQEDASINVGIAADPDARELNIDWFKKARPALEVLSELIGKKNAEALVKRRGRPAGSGTTEA